MVFISHFIWDRCQKNELVDMKNFRENKEEIKDRMIRTAMDYWNVKKVENLDPFIRLLIEALSMQLHVLSEDIADIETRTMRRLSEVLLPEAMTVVHPAHAIIQLSPTMDGVMTNYDSEFLFFNQRPGEKREQSYPFFPVCRTPLHEVDVKMMIIDGDVYEVQPDMNKRLVLRQNSTPEMANKVYVGLDLKNKDLQLQHLSFYLDFPNIDGRGEYLQRMSYSTWECNGIKLSVSNGLYVDRVENENGLPEFFAKNANDVSVNNEVLDFYRLRYFTIESQIKATNSDLKKIPMVYTPYLEEYKTVCTSDLLWIEVNFPPAFSQTILSDLQVCLNTVPVVNKQLNQLSKLVKKDFGVLPIDVEEEQFYFDVVNVSDEYGRIYNRTYGYNENSSDLTYTLRRGGCESFDKRDAKEFLLHLRGLLEDEMSIFSSLKGGVTSNGYEIERLLQKIGANTDMGGEELELPYYLFVEPPQQSTLFYVKYWTSAGVNANGLRIGQKAQIGDTLYSHVSQAILLTPSLGGKSAPTERERIARFKYILGSRNRIVTNNDIKSFIVAELPDLVSDVRIEKGISRGSQPNQGLIRTIDVHLILNRKLEDKKQQEQILDELYDHMVAQSPMTFNYRIFVD